MQKHSGYMPAMYESIFTGLFCIDEYVSTQEIKIARFKLNVLIETRFCLDLNSLFLSLLYFPITYVYQLSFWFGLHFCVSSLLYKVMVFGFPSRRLVCTCDFSAVYEVYGWVGWASFVAVP